MAIAFDASGGPGLVNPGTSYTWNHTVGTGAILVVYAYTFTGSTGPTGVTFNGVAMTNVVTFASSFTPEIWTSWISLNPTSGTHAVVVTQTSGDGGTGASLSYTGCDTTTNPTSQNHADGTDSGTNITTVNVTTPANGALVGWAGRGNSITNGVVGGTERVHDPNIFNGGWGDVLGLSAGSNAYTPTFSSLGGTANVWISMAMALQPPASGGTKLPFKSLLGVGI